MKDMISEIVSLDKKERELTEQVQHKKMNAQQEIILLKNKIREEYIAHARKRIKINEQTEVKAADASWEVIKNKQDKISKNLDKLFEEKSDKWVETIVNNVIGE